FVRSASYAMQIGFDFSEGWPFASDFSTFSANFHDANDGSLLPWRRMPRARRSTTPSQGEPPCYPPDLAPPCRRSCCSVSSARPDLISDWNAKAEAIAVEKRLLPPPNARTMAILHVAMFEAVNAIERRYAPYRLNLAPDRNASKEAAAATAAHTVLSGLFHDQQASLDSTLKASLAAIADGDPKTKGVELGKKAAAEILALRAGDGADVLETYRPHTIPGAYVPTVVPVSSTYGRTTPWAMQNGSQFRPAPPPALDSQTWTNDLNEIRELGSR